MLTNTALSVQRLGLSAPSSKTCKRGDRENREPLLFSLITYSYELTAQYLNLVYYLGLKMVVNLSVNNLFAEYWQVCEIDISSSF